MMLVDLGHAVAIISLTLLLILIAVGFIIWQTVIGFTDQAGRLMCFIF